MTVLSLFLLMAVGFASARGAEPTADPSGLPGREELGPLLRSIADWTLTTNVQSNNITNNKDTLSTSIFINGNLARVLLAAHTIFDGNETYLEAGLEWCDTFVKLQHLQDTHDGRHNAAGWWDTGYSELYIADTGTAVTALALCYDLVRDGKTSQPKRAAAYLESMLRFADFVVNGTATTPQCDFKPGCSYDSKGNETETTHTWLQEDKALYGVLGDGYYMQRLNLPPYTISTATTGGAFFSELSAILKDTAPTPASELRGYARGAVDWLLRIVQPNGTIPYYIYPPTMVEHTYQCASYSAEAILDADLRGIYPVSSNSSAERVVKYLIAQQQPSGELIGPEASTGEQQRSPRAISFMQWWYGHSKDPAIAAAIHSYFEFVNAQLHNQTSTYGLNEYALVTGFVGLAAADLISPWCTFSRM